MIAAFAGIALLALIIDRKHPLSGQMVTLSLIIAGFSLYLAYTGGDLFEFRLLEPVVAMIALLVPIALEWLTAERPKEARPSRLSLPMGALAAVFGAALMARLFYIDQTREYVTYLISYNGVVSVDSLQRFDWYNRLRPIGQWLHLYADPKERLAVSVAGVIPYFSELPTLDTLGLNDRYVASMKLETRGMLGHERMAPRDYLVKSNVVYHYLTGIDPQAASGQPNDYLTAQGMDGAWHLFETFVKDPDELRGALRRRGAIVWPGPREDKSAVWAANRANWEEFRARAVVLGFDPKPYNYVPLEPPPPAVLDNYVLGVFDDGTWGAWTASGRAFEQGPMVGSVGSQSPIAGTFSGGIANSFTPRMYDAATGELVSPEFTPTAGQHLTFSVGGGGAEKVGVMLLGPKGPIETWRGKNSEVMEEVSFDLSAWSGQQLSIKIFDDSDEAWGHILADNFAVK